MQKLLFKIELTIDNNLKQINQNNTIGIIITKKDNDIVIMNTYIKQYIQQFKL